MGARGQAGADGRAIGLVMAEADFDYEAALLACAGGDQAALRRIYERESRWLMGVALRIVRRRELADEVLHDAFLQIWQKCTTYNPALGSARGWIYSVVRHRALNVLRDRQREDPSGDVSLDDIPDGSADPADSVSRASEASALHRCLKHLDEQKRVCILLAFVDGYTHQQIAARLATPLGTVKAWIRRGLLSLRDCLA